MNYAAETSVGFEPTAMQSRGCNPEPYHLASLTNDDYEKAMLDGVSALIPYYEHVLGIESIVDDMILPRKW